MADPVDVVLMCAASDVQPDGSCLHPVWVQAPTLIPPLTVGDALMIGSAVIGVWALAAAYRSIRRVFD